MYRQVSSHLNRHILVTWQSIGVVAGALAVFVLGDKLDMKADARLDFVIALVILLCAWSCAHIYDASNWFDRNLHIITNIERQFLRSADSRDIHYYFTLHRGERDEGGEERSSPSMITHFEIQLLMAVVLWLLLLLYHFYLRVYPGLHLSFDHLDPIRGIPYAMTLLCVWYCIHIARDRKKDYRDLHEKSPGAAVHGVKEQ